MFLTLSFQRGGTFYKSIGVLVLAFTFLVQTTPTAHLSYAQELSIETLPAPDEFVYTSVAYSPVVLTGIQFYPDDPLKFDFIIDEGDVVLSDEELKTEITQLVKYFLASLTIPEEELWVNLAPFEKDKVISGALSLTDMGKELLGEDYILKQFMATLTYPDSENGKAFWSKVYDKAYQLYGTSEIPISTFNKIWIVPDKAVVYEAQDKVFIKDTHLRVMMEEDYFALKENKKNTNTKDFSLEKEDVEKIHDVSADVVREVLLPQIEKEVNSGKNFATLRQVYNSLILATWFKAKVKESVLNRVYADKKKIGGIHIEDTAVKEKVYEQYMQAYRNGVYDYIKKDYDENIDQHIKRKYHSGGMAFSGLGGLINSSAVEAVTYAPIRAASPVIANFNDLSNVFSDLQSLDNQVKLLDTAQDRGLVSEEISLPAAIGSLKGSLPNVLENLNVSDASIKAQRLNDLGTQGLLTKSAIVEVAPELAGPSAQRVIDMAKTIEPMDFQREQVASLVQQVPASEVTQLFNELDMPAASSTMQELAGQEWNTRLLAAPLNVQAASPLATFDSFIEIAPEFNNRDMQTSFLTNIQNKGLMSNDVSLVAATKTLAQRADLSDLTAALTDLGIDSSLQKAENIKALLARDRLTLRTLGNNIPELTEPVNAHAMINAAQRVEPLRFQQETITEVAKSISVQELEGVFTDLNIPDATLKSDALKQEPLVQGRRLATVKLVPTASAVTPASPLMNFDRLSQEISELQERPQLSSAIVNRFKENSPVEFQSASLAPAVQTLSQDELTNALTDLNIPDAPEKAQALKRIQFETPQALIAVAPELGVDANATSLITTAQTLKADDFARNALPSIAENINTAELTGLLTDSGVESAPIKATNVKNTIENNRSMVEVLQAEAPNVTVPGGIDLSPENFNIEIKGEGIRITYLDTTFDIDNVGGFTFQILEINNI